MASGTKVPRWNLNSIYPGYDSKEYAADRAALIKTTASLLKKLGDTAAMLSDKDAAAPPLDGFKTPFEAQGCFVHCWTCESPRRGRYLRKGLRHRPFPSDHASRHRS